ncbi:hypothetical protein TB2_003474 [Malus domestica]
MGPELSELSALGREGGAQLWVTSIILPEDLCHVKDGRRHGAHPEVESIGARVPKEKSHSEQLGLNNHSRLGQHY